MKIACDVACEKNVFVYSPLIDISSDQQQAAIQRRNDDFGDVIKCIDFQALVGKVVVWTAHQTNKSNAGWSIDHEIWHALTSPRL